MQGHSTYSEHTRRITHYKIRGVRSPCSASLSSYPSHHRLVRKLSWKVDRYSQLSSLATAALPIDQAGCVRIFRFVAAQWIFRFGRQYSASHRLIAGAAAGQQNFSGFSTYSKLLTLGAEVGMHFGIHGGHINRSASLDRHHLATPIA